jgi:hypothetical protein
MAENALTSALKNLKSMKQNVKLVFDRKKQVEKTGSGKIELCIYLARREVKWETVATSDLENWESVAQGRNIQAKLKHYETSSLCRKGTKKSN